MIAASTGNHGQSVAFAARLFGVPARICVPEGANPVKMASMRALGAELVVQGADFDEAREHCEALARSTATATSTPATSRCSSPASARARSSSWRTSRRST